MRPIWLWLPLAILLSTLVPVRAGGPLFPEAGTAPRPDGPARVIQLGKTLAVRIEPVRFEPAPGQTDFRNVRWCGVSLTEDGGRPVGIVTIGEGVTDSVSCGGLVDAGVLPGAQRIGLVYRTASPNATALTPVVLARDPATGIWAVDNELSEQLGEALWRPSIPAMRRSLNGR